MVPTRDNNFASRNIYDNYIVDTDNHNDPGDNNGDNNFASRNIYDNYIVDTDKPDGPGDNNFGSRNIYDNYIVDTNNHNGPGDNLVYTKDDFVHGWDAIIGSGSDSNNVASDNHK